MNSLMIYFFAIQGLFWGKAKTIGDKVKWSVEKEGFTYLKAHLLSIQGRSGGHAMK